MTDNFGQGQNPSGTTVTFTKYTHVIQGLAAATTYYFRAKYSGPGAIASGWSMILTVTTRSGLLECSILIH